MLHGMKSQSAQKGNLICVCGCVRCLPDIKVCNAARYENPRSISPKDANAMPLVVREEASFCQRAKEQRLMVVVKRKSDL